MIRLRTLSAHAPTLSSDDQQWRLDALCAQVAGETFYVDQGGSSVAAKKLCSDCPVRAECLTDAMRVESDLPDFRSRYGVYGGLSPNERARLTKRGWRAGDPLPDVNLHRGGRPLS